MNVESVTNCHIETRGLTPRACSLTTDTTTGVPKRNSIPTLAYIARDWGVGNHRHRCPPRGGTGGQPYN